MALSVTSKELLVAVTVAVVVAVSGDTDIEMATQSKRQKIEYVPIGPTTPVDVYNDLKGSPFFKRTLGISENIFSYIHDNLKNYLLTPRNVRYEYTEAENELRRSRPCKASTENRIALFLYRLKGNIEIWTSTEKFGSNITTISDDFRHVSQWFVKIFDPIWIRNMTDDESQQAQNLFETPNALYAIDGKQFLRRRSVILPPNTKRSEFYCHKHKWPEGENDQAKVNGLGIICELLTGVPGGMNDQTAASYMCQNDRPGTVIKDGGYRNRDEYIENDDDDEDAKKKRS